MNIMMEKLYQQLGFHLVRDKLAGYTLTENANLKALSAVSFLPKSIYLLKQQQNLEMRDLLALDTPLPLIGFPTQDDIISKGRVKGTILHEEELYGLAEIMQHARQVSAYFHQRENKYSELKKLIKVYNPDLIDLEQQLFKLFNSERQIADNASAELARLRKKINKIDQNIRIKVSHIASEWMDRWSCRRTEPTGDPRRHRPPPAPRVRSPRRRAGTAPCPAPRTARSAPGPWSA